MFVPRLRLVLGVSAAAATLALAVAVGSERWGRLVPCALCLVERWPYRIVLAVALLGLVLPRRLAWIALYAMLLGVAAAALTAAVHVGVERLWWPSPLPECAAPNIAGLSIADRLARMPDVASKSCEDPTLLVSWIPVSMAEMNLLFALAFAAGVASFLFTTRRSTP